MPLSASDIELPNQPMSDSKPAASSPKSPASPVAAKKAVDAAPAASAGTAAPASTGPFGIPIKDLQHFVDPKNKEALDRLGGLDAILKGLKVDPDYGLHTDETFGNKPAPDAAGKTMPFAERSAIYGRNVLPEVKSATLLQLMWDAYQDKILQILSVAAVVSLAIGLYEDFGPDRKPGDTPIHWVEGFAIFMAVSIVVMVSSLNDYQKEKQFRKLNARKEDRKVKVIRDGQQVQISVFDLQVGDIMTVEPGDLISVDGVLVTSHNLKADESSATGESDLIKKQAYGADCVDPFMISGSKINEGVGKYVVTAVGVNSFYGKTMMGLRVEQEDTPLQVKLGGLAETIAKFGASASILLLVILLIKFLVKFSTKGWPSAAEVAQKIIHIFIQSIIIVVVAIPEGLPLAVTLALAYATTRMLEDNNLVRILASCETMGGATTICSDKTGTLTQNKMTVVAGVVGVDMEFKENSGIDKLKTRFLDNKLSPIGVKAGLTSLTGGEYHHLLTESIALNSTAFEETNEKGQKEFIGSKTEVALLNWGRRLGLDNFQQVRADAAKLVSQVYPFSSERKSMITVIKRKTPDGQWVYRAYSKGASEIVLKFCSRVVKCEEGHKAFKIVESTQKIQDQLLRSISSYAQQTLRTICLAFCELSEAEYKKVTDSDGHAELSADASAALEKYIQANSCMLTIVGIEDPLRDGVSEAVRKCQHAGVIVRMVTGDNITTAKAIATKCGIYTKGGVAMEGSRFRTLSTEEMDEILPRLQVLARSSPTDKQMLVQRLKQLGDTVAVTGDGTNDGPALKMADIGFSMGIAGTEVAKEASSIILMDDNFSSIVKAMMWGRCVSDSVKKFLQFQLSINVSAVLIAFITSIANEENASILTAVQLLWINLIMDSLAALALATDAPTEEILDRYPESKKSPLITVTMWKMIIGQAAYQVSACLTLNYISKTIFPNETDEQHKTLVFNAFVCMQIFNLLNCRRIDTHMNIFHNMLKNRFFIPILIAIIAGQVLIVFFGGEVFKTTPITGYMWLASVIVGSITLPIGVIVRLIPDWDGCTVCGVQMAVPDRSRVVMTKERMQWQDSSNKVRTELSVFNALRGTPRHDRALSKSQNMEASGSQPLQPWDAELKPLTSSSNADLKNAGTSAGDWHPELLI